MKGRKEIKNWSLSIHRVLEKFDWDPSLSLLGKNENPIVLIFCSPKIYEFQNVKKR